MTEEGRGTKRRRTDPELADAMNLDAAQTFTLVAPVTFPPAMLRNIEANDLPTLTEVLEHAQGICNAHRFIVDEKDVDVAALCRQVTVTVLNYLDKTPNGATTGDLGYYLVTITYPSDVEIFHDDQQNLIDTGKGRIRSFSTKTTLRDERRIEHSFRFYSFRKEIPAASHVT